MNDPGEAQWNEDMLGVHWQASEDDVIGDWCVQPEGSSMPSDGGLEVAAGLTEELAEHVADLHNAWLDERERIRHKAGLPPLQP